MNTKNTLYTFYLIKNPGNSSISILKSLFHNIFLIGIYIKIINVVLYGLV